MIRDIQNSEVLAVIERAKGRATPNHIIRKVAKNGT